MSKGVIKLVLTGLLTIVLSGPGCLKASQEGGVESDIGVDSQGIDTGDTVISDSAGPPDPPNKDVVGDAILPDNFGDASKADAADDCEEGEGCFLSPCEGTVDCEEYCVPHMGGKVCTDPCIEVCPDGFSCQPVTGFGADTLYLCVSSHPHLCKPCVDSTACSGAGATDTACIQYDAPEGRFCGAICNENKACPVGFVCQTMTTVEGSVGDHCVPEVGSCPCSKHAADNALQTVCSNETDAGTCQGTRVCTEAGLTPCDADSPKPELCDGLDNDCDGQYDEDTCDDANVCTANNCSPDLGCNNPPVNDVLCSDGNDCTVNDICQDGGCVGTGTNCDDGNDCTQDSCDDAGACTYQTLVGVECSDSSACTLNDHCDAGLCVGDAMFCDDKNSCTADSCDPINGCVYEQLNGGCDDGDLCTMGDTCIDGSCQPDALLACNDSNQCTVDTCDPDQGCVYIHTAGACDDGNACTLVDQCIDGQCSGFGNVQCPLGQQCDEGVGCIPKTKVWAHSSSKLYRIDLDTFQVDDIGGFGVPITDIGEAQDGTLYGISFTALYVIDTDTGSATEVGFMGIGNANGMTVAPDGTIYVGDLSGNLHTVNPNDGTSALVGPYGAGFTSSGDIVWGPLSAIYVSDPNGGTDQLLSVNPATGGATVVGDIGFGEVYGLAFAKGALYGFDASGNIIHINYLTGEGTVVFDANVVFWGGT